MDEATRKLNEAFQTILLQHEVDMVQARIAAAKADPVKNKTTLQWDGPLRSLYYDGGIDRRGVRRRFFYSTTRNAAGYFLSWVEVWNAKKGRGERTRFVASKKRHLMDARAKRLWTAWRNRKANQS
jgi:hypothetical protein